MPTPDAICSLEVPVIFVLSSHAQQPAPGVGLYRTYTFSPEVHCCDRLSASLAAQHMLMDLQALGLRVEIRP